MCLLTFFDGSFPSNQSRRLRTFTMIIFIVCVLYRNKSVGVAAVEQFSQMETALSPDSEAPVTTPRIETRDEPQHETSGGSSPNDDKDEDRNMGKNEEPRKKEEELKQPSKEMEDVKQQKEKEEGEEWEVEEQPKQEEKVEQEQEQEQKEAPDDEGRSILNSNNNMKQEVLPIGKRTLFAHNVPIPEQFFKSKHRPQKILKMHRQCLRVPCLIKQ